MNEWKGLIEIGVLFAAFLGVIIPLEIRQGNRTDKLYEMFIDLLKDKKGVK